MAEVVVASGSSSKPKVTIVVAVILACVVLFCLLAQGPCLISAIRRGRQKRATTEVVSISAAIEAYKRQNGHCPGSAKSQEPVWQFAPLGHFSRDLTASAGKEIPLLDPWGNAYLYGCKASDDCYCIVCLGNNGKMESKEIPTQFKGTHCFESDIIAYNGQLVQASEGKQVSCGDAGYRE